MESSESKRITDIEIISAAQNECEVLNSFGDENGCIHLFSSLNRRSRIKTLSLSNNAYYQITVSDDPIYDMLWIDRTNLIYSSGLDQIHEIDFTNATIINTGKHKSSVKCLQKICTNTFLSGGFDGKVYLNDRRTPNEPIELKISGRKKKSSVSSLCLAEDGNTIYATSTPNICISNWDLRYQRRGKYISKQQEIHDNPVRSILNTNNFLYLLLSNSKIMKLTEEGEFIKYISESKTVENKYGKIGYHRSTDMVYSSISDKIKFFDLESENIIEKNTESNNGFIFDSNSMLVYTTDGFIRKEQIRYNIKYTHKLGSTIWC